METAKPCKGVTSSKEAEEKFIIKGKSLNHAPDPKGIGYVLFYGMLEHRNSIGQIDSTTGEEDTYGALLQRSIRTAIVMRTSGVTPDHVISICSNNNFNSCVPLISALFLGAKVAPLDPGLSLLETTHLVKLYKPKIIFVGPEAVQLVESAVQDAAVETEIVVFGATEKHTNFDQYLEAQPDENEFLPVVVSDIKDTALILCTSGTTGTPKGICISHRSFLNRIGGFRLPRTFSILMSTSFYWIVPVIFLCMSIVSGTCRVLAPKFDENIIWQIVARYKISVILPVGVHLNALAKTSIPKDLDLSCLKSIATGGVGSAKGTIAKLGAMLPSISINVSYGLVENTGTVTSTPSWNEETFSKKMDSCGVVTSGNWCKIVDPVTEELLPPNQTGELLVKSEYQMNGYYNDDDSDRFDANRWLKTGDIAYYDEDHCFYIVGRLKQMIVFGYWPVATSPIEAVLETHPSVAQGVVVGVPHEEDGEQPLAVVVLNSEEINVTASDIEQFVAERVRDEQKLRAGVRFVKVLPVTPTGKVKRKLVQEMVLSGKL